MTGRSAHPFSAELWIHPGEGGWHFLTVPEDVSADVAERTAAVRRGFGSVRVVATVAGRTWRTSLFPDRASGGYLLPVKKAVRDAAALRAGDVVQVELDVEAIAGEGSQRSHR